MIGVQGDASLSRLTSAVMDSEEAPRVSTLPVLQFMLHWEKGAINRVTKENDELDPRVKSPDSLHCGLPVGVYRSTNRHDELGCSLLRAKRRSLPFLQNRPSSSKK